MTNDLTTAYIMGASDEKEKWRNKIKDKIKELEDEGYWDFYEEVDLKKTIKILKDLLEEGE